MVPTNALDFRANLLVETMATCNLLQFQNVPNINNRLLDLVFCTVSSIQVYGADPLSCLDKHHPAIVIDASQVDIPKSLRRKNTKHLNFYKSDFNKIKSKLLSIDWSEALSLVNIDDCVTEFHEKLNEIIQRHTPKSKSNPRNCPIWYSPALKHCLDEKNKYHKLFKMYSNPRDYDTSFLRSRCKKLTKQCYQSFLKSVEESLESNIKGFWKFINSKKGHVSIPQTVSYGQASSSSGVGICELFSKYFGSVLVNDDTSLMDVPIDADADDLKSVNSLAQINIVETISHQK